MYWQNYKLCTSLFGSSVRPHHDGWLCVSVWTRRGMHFPIHFVTFGIYLHVVVVGNHWEMPKWLDILGYTLHRDRLIIAYVEVNRFLL